MYSGFRTLLRNSYAKKGVLNEMSFKLLVVGLQRLFDEEEDEATCVLLPDDLPGRDEDAFPERRERGGGFSTCFCFDLPLPASRAMLPLLGTAAFFSAAFLFRRSLSFSFPASDLECLSVWEIAADLRIMNKDGQWVLVSEALKPKSSASNLSKA